MVQITNRTGQPFTYAVEGSKPGAAKYDSVRPGETKDLDLYDRNGAVLRGQEAAGAIFVNDALGRKAEAESASSAVPTGRKATSATKGRAGTKSTAGSASGKREVTAPATKPAAEPGLTLNS